jgi:hypothetical protein
MEQIKLSKAYIVSTWIQHPEKNDLMAVKKDSEQALIYIKEMHLKIKDK